MISFDINLFFICICSNKPKLFTSIGASTGADDIIDADVGADTGTNAGIGASVSTGADASASADVGKLIWNNESIYRYI